MSMPFTDVAMPQSQAWENLDLSRERYWLEHIDELLDAYRSMRLVRLFDRKCIALQRTGQLGTYPSCEGAEAIGLGTAHAMRTEDVLVPYYRDQAAQLARGVQMGELLLYWGGDERGSDYGRQTQSGPREDFPVCIPIATQCTHATGVASAFKIRHQKRVAVCSLGDGATSKGDFLEAINLAGAWQLPVVFVINSNQWAISTPRAIQCAAGNLADKALGAGFKGKVVDGNDYLAVREAVAQAVERARAGKGPGLIECLSYRLSDHTTADDARRYRRADELEAARPHDPLSRLEAFLRRNNHWDEKREAALTHSCEQQIEAAVQRYLNTPPRPPESMFDHLYAELPHAYRTQYQKLQAKSQGADRD